MIAKGKAISHGHAMAEYAMHKEKAQLVCVRGLPDNLEPMSLVNRMMLEQAQKHKDESRGRKLEKHMLRFEVSPVNDNNEGWTLEQWKQLVEEFLAELDSVTSLPNKPNAKFDSTNASNSMYIATLHHDSDGKVRHLHILVNRVDDNGITNDSKFIGQRATLAANNVTKRHGWVQAMDRRIENINEITDACMDILRKMHKFSWDEYEEELTKRGYQFKSRKEKEGKVVGYTIKRGNSTYKASDLRAGKQLHASHIEATHAKLHAPNKSADNANATLDTSKPLLVRNWNFMDVVVSDGYKNHNPDQMFRLVHRDSYGTYPIKISKNALDALDAELEQPLIDIETGDVSLPGRTALLLFGEYLSAATSMSASCGGGGSPGGGWGRNKEDDDEKWARRCARMATHMCKPKAITVGRKLKR